MEGSKPTPTWLPIPTKPSPSTPPQPADGTSPSSYADSSSPSSYAPSAALPTPKGKGKAAPDPASDPPQTPPRGHRRSGSSRFCTPEDDGIPRPPLLSPSFAAREELCVNVGTEEHPRLVTLVTATQGYEFNRALFLPPRFVREYEAYGDELRDNTEVVDVFVTEEEAREMLLD